MSITNVKSEVEEVISELLNKLSALDEKELNTRPAANEWSSAQIAEHLLKSYGVAETIAGPTSETTRPDDEKVAGIKGIFLNFEVKYDSPDFILPSGDLISKDALLQGLKERQTAIANAAETNDLTLTCTSFELPGLGYLTRLEWLRFVQYHTQRHLRQLEKTISTIKQQSADTLTAAGETSER